MAVSLDVPSGLHHVLALRFAGETVTTHRMLLPGENAFMSHVSEDESVDGMIIKSLASKTHRSIEEAREAYEGEFVRLQCVSKVKAFISIIATHNARETLLRK